MRARHPCWQQGPRRTSPQQRLLPTPFRARRPARSVRRANLATDGGGMTHKLRVGFLAAIALLSVLAATPAAAKPRAVNGQIAFGRDDPLVGSTVLYIVNPDGSHERQLLPLGLGSPHWSPDGGAIV